MAEAKNVSFDSIMNDLKARKFLPVYYLMGDESYYIDQISDYIAEHVLPPEERDFNQTILFGSDVTAAQIADAARRYPMMSEYQVVIVKEAQNIKNTEALEKYFKAPQTSTILVLCHKNGTIDGRKREYVKAIQVAGVLFESKKLRDRDLPPFIENYLKRKNVSIDAKSTQIIADSIGADLSRLTSELEKVILSLPEQDRRVTPQVVEEQIGVSKDFNSFELRDAIVNRNVFKANQIVKYFDDNPKQNPIQAVLPSLFRLFSQLMIAYYSPGKDKNSVAQYLGIQPWQVERNIFPAMRNYSAAKVLSILSVIRDTDEKSKGFGGSKVANGDLLKQLVFFILH